VAYCRSLGFVDTDIRAQLGFLTFPLLFGVMFGFEGSVAALAVAVLFVAGWLKAHAAELRSLVVQVRNA